MPKKASKIEINQRAERIQAAIAQLSKIKTEIEAQGEIAPQGCYVARYQARGQKYRYWYYQLKAPEAIFLKTNSENEYSRYQHLGSSGSEAHINGVLAVVRRVQIDELTKAIDGLKESWLDLYSDEKTVSNGETGFIYSPPYPKMPIQMKNPPSLLSKKEIQAIA